MIKKKVIAGRPRPKISKLTELILQFSFDLENILVVNHISKKCRKISAFNLKIVKICWQVGAEHQAPYTPAAHRCWPEVGTLSLIVNNEANFFINLLIR